MELLTLIAILMGPAIGVRIAMRVEERRQKRQQKIDVLASLLRTSQGTARQSPEHVGALNLIRLIFHGEKNVIKVYERYMEHLNPPQPVAQNAIAAYNQRGNERFLDLLDALASTLGYSFNKEDFEKSSYAPQMWLNYEVAQWENMNLINRLLKGESFLRVAPPPSQTEDSSAQPPVSP